MKKGIIYYLSRKSDGKVFYIGLTTKNLFVRLEGHVNGAKQYFGRRHMNTEKNVFIRDCNFEIEITEIEVVFGDNQHLSEREKYWINEYVKKNPELTNIRGKKNFTNPDKALVQLLPWSNLLDLPLYHTRTVSGNVNTVKRLLKSIYPDRKHYTKKLVDIKYKEKTKIVRLK